MNSSEFEFSDILQAVKGIDISNSYISLIMIILRMWISFSIAL